MINSVSFEGYLIVVTYGRSGSTLLQSILQSIPGYSFTGENNNVLLPLFHAFLRAEDAKKRFGKTKKAKERP